MAFAGTTWLVSGGELPLPKAKYGMLTPLGPDGKNKFGQPLWKLRCDCGKEISTTIYRVRYGHSKSCGCVRGRKLGDLSRTHGLGKTRLSGIWNSMRTRCQNEKSPAYKYYGARGITVCKEWDESLEVFVLWAEANGYSDDLSIDRIDNDGNYEPGNCRWATAKEQARNTRRKLATAPDGRLWSEVATDNGIPEHRYRKRLAKGWDPASAATQVATGARHV